MSLSLYSGQMCTAPQNIYIPRKGIEAESGLKSFDEVVSAITTSIDAIASDPVRGPVVFGAIANPQTLGRIDRARTAGRVVRDSNPIPTQSGARTATPLIVVPSENRSEVSQQEWFGPIFFVIGVDDSKQGVQIAASTARKSGALTVGLYETDETIIESAVDQLTGAGVNISINLTGPILVNQSAAFSDLHGTTSNPAGTSLFTDWNFVTKRFHTAMWRRQDL